MPSPLDRHQHAVMGVAPHGLRPVAGPAGPAAPGDPVVAVAILPMVGLATSLGGIAQSANPVWAATGWALALLAFLPLGWAFGQNRAVRLHPEDGRLEIAGGWFVLGFDLDLRRALYDGRAVWRAARARGEALWICLSGAVAAWLRASAWLARQPAVARPSLDGGCTVRLIALLALALSTSLATSLAVLPSNASISRCARTCSPAWTATRPPSTAR